MATFAELKKRSRNQTADDLKQKMATKQRSSHDDRFWKPTMKKVEGRGDTVGTSRDVIRFLPMGNKDLRMIADGKYSEDFLSPLFVRKHHAFQGPGGWYIQESRAMIGDACPVYERVKPKWDAAKEADNKAQMERIKAMFTKETVIANILVVNDGSNPENNGKVFLFRVTKDMKKLLDAAMDPLEADIVAFNPFDVDTGHNCNLVLTYESRRIGNNSFSVGDYAKVNFNETSSPIADSDEAVEEILDQCHSMLAYLNDIKSEDELNKMLDKVFTFKEAREDTQEQAPAKTESEAPPPTVPTAATTADLSEYEALLS